MINIKKLAQIAGVDVSTVSRALNDSERVKPKTKAYIKALAEQHNYVPNDMARSLVGKKSFTIGVLVPEFINTFYAEVIEGLDSVFYDLGYTMIFGKSRFKHEEETKIIDMFVLRKVDGIVMCSASMVTVEYLMKLKKSIPVVLTDSYDVYDEMDMVSIDNERGVNFVIEHLLSLGHSRFGYIGDSKITRLRLEAFRTGLAQRGANLDERHIFIGEERYENGGYCRMNEMLALADRPTAIFAGTDNLAIGAIHAVRERQLRIPADISIVGFDDILASAYAEVPLTTVLQPKMEMGQQAAQLLLERINEEPSDFRHVVLQPQLIVRQTTSYISV